MFPISEEFTDRIEFLHTMGPLRLIGTQQFPQRNTVELADSRMDSIFNLIWSFKRLQLYLLFIHFPRLEVKHVIIFLKPKEALLLCHFHMFSKASATYVSVSGILHRLPYIIRMTAFFFFICFGFLDWFAGANQVMMQHCFSFSRQPWSILKIRSNPWLENSSASLQDGMTWVCRNIKFRKKWPRRRKTDEELQLHFRRGPDGPSATETKMLRRVK